MYVYSVTLFLFFSPPPQQEFAVLKSYAGTDPITVYREEIVTTVFIDL